MSSAPRTGRGEGAAAGALCALAALLAAAPAWAVEKWAVANGNWSVGTTWNGGTLPGSTDNVTIADPYVVNLDQNATVNDLTVGGGGAGTLKIGTGVNQAYTLTIDGSCSVLVGGRIEHADLTNKDYVIQFKGNVSNSGAIDCYAASNRTIAIEFIGSSNSTIFDADGGTWDLYSVTINKGTTGHEVRNQSTEFWTTGSAWGSTSGAVVFTQGIYVHANPSTWNVTEHENANPFAIPAAFTVKVMDGLMNVYVASGDAGGDIELRGTLSLEGGDFTLGDASGEDFYFRGTTGVLKVLHLNSTLDIAGQLGYWAGADRITYEQTNGTVIVNHVGSTFAGLQLDATSFTMGGGTLILYAEVASKTPYITSYTATPSVTEGTIQFGDAGATASTFNFKCNSSGAGNVAVKPRHVRVYSGHTLKLTTSSLTVQRDVTIDSTATLDLNGLNLTCGGNFTNDGNFDATTVTPTTTTFDGSSGLTQTIGGSSNTTFFNLTVSGGSASTVQTRTGSADTLEVKGALSVSGLRKLLINSGDTLKLSRVGTGFPPQKHTISGNGTLELMSGTTLLPVTTVQLGNFQQLEIGSGATLKTVPDAVEGYSFADKYVRFTRAGASGGYSVYCADGSFVDIGFVKFEYLYGRSTAGRNEFTEATVESAFAVSTDKANIAWFAKLWFDLCVDPVGPNARFPRYLYFLEETNDAKDWNGMAGLGYLDKLRFDDNVPTPAGQSNIEKRCPVGGTSTTFYPRNNKDDMGVAPFGLTGLEADDMDGDRGAGDTGVEDIIFSQNPTAVTLADLRASGYDGAVVVEWRTAQEFDNLGFNVYRSRFPDRDWVQVNPGMILGMGDSQVGGRYYFLDRTVANGARYYYMLEDVDFRGTRTLSGPVDALPLAGLGQPALNDADYVNHGRTGGEADTVPTAGRDVPPALPGGRDGTFAERLVGIDLAKAGIRLISLDETGALIEILPPEPTLTPEVWDGKLAYRIEMVSYSATRVVGMPEVPTKGILLVTPEIERATARILEVDSRSLTGMNLVRTPPPGLPSGRTGSGRTGGGASNGTRARPRSLTVMEMIAEAREELLAKLLARRKELEEARKKGREEVARRGRSGKGGRGVGAAPGAGAGKTATGAELFPGSLVGLGGLTRHLGRQLLPIQINPVQVAPGRVDIYRRILVRIDFVGARPPGGETPGSGEGLFDTPAQVAVAADGTALKITVSQDGLYRLTRAGLAGAGLAVSGDPRTIRMYNLGREIAIRVVGEIDGVFNEGDEVVFYGRKNPWRTTDNPEATRHTDENVYWLTIATGFGKRMEDLWMRPAEGRAAAGDHPATLHSETNSTYYPRLLSGAGKDHWFAGTTLYNTAGGSRPTARATFTLGTPALSGSPHTARLDVALAGVSDYGADPDHRVVVSLNGQVLGDARWNGRFGHREVFEFPSSMLHAGNNTVELFIPCDLPGVANDQVLLNYLRLSYRRLLVAESDRVFFTGDAGGEFAVTGFVSAEVGGADVSDPAVPRWIRGMAVAGGTARFNDSATRTGGRYALAGSGALRSPDRIERNSPSSWHDGGNQADWVAIAHPSLLGGVSPLADHRRSQGLATATADVTDLYDEWTAGIPDPIAIRAFLAHARARWARPAPRFALLVGDGSSDPHGYRWPGSDLVPAPLVQMDSLWSASDGWYAAVEGEDELPDLAIGRLAVRTPEALAAAIEKILAHETGPSEDWHREVTLVADNDDAAYDFSRAVAGYADLFGPDYDVEEIQLGELGTTEARNRTRAALSAGRLLVGYMGHGSAVAWANENLFHANDVASLTNDGRYGLVTALGCMNGMYHLPNLDCLGEVVVRTERRGGMAFWGSTSLVAPGPQEDVYRELVPLLTGGTGRTLGEAIAEAEIRTWTEGGEEDDVLRAWVLLGDPATRLR